MNKVHPTIPRRGGHPHLLLCLFTPQDAKTIAINNNKTTVWFTFRIIKNKFKIRNFLHINHFSKDFATIIYPQKSSRCTIGLGSGACHTLYIID